MDKVSRLLAVINIELLILLVLVFVHFLEREKVAPVQDTLVLGTQNEETSPSADSLLTICADEVCTQISKKDVSVEDGIDEKLLNIFVLENIYPFFEKEFGGKSLASSSQGSYIYWKRDRIPDLSNITETILLGFENNVEKVSIEVKDLPGTNGWYAEKYIEVDNSKQKLYVWENGVVVKEILLSPAKDGYQVYGVYKIIDKGINPIAPTGRYMPYWMAFYYSKNQDSWWGLHGLVWWYDENGKAIYESENNIGVRRSGGCIRMLKDDAKYLYDRFDKGDLILLHE